MNIVEYLTQEGAIGCTSKRSEIALRVLREEIKATVTIHTEQRFNDLPTLLRATLRGDRDGCVVSASSVKECRAELTKLAAGQEADFEVLRRVQIQPVSEANSGGAATIKPVQRSKAQEEEILTALRELGYRPTELPKRQNGRPGTKAAAWKTIQEKERKSCGTKVVFDKAWLRLRANREIAEEA